MTRFDNSSGAVQEQNCDSTGPENADRTRPEPESYRSVLTTFFRSPATLVSIVLVTVATGIHAGIVVPPWTALLADSVWIQVLVVTGTGLLVIAVVGLTMARLWDSDPVVMYPNLYPQPHHYAHRDQLDVLKESAFRHVICRFVLAVIISGYVTPALLWAGWLSLSVP